MKKGIIAIIAAVTLLSACGSSGASLPTNMSEDTYELGQNALEIMEKYNGGDIDKDTAESRLDSISVSLDNVDYIEPEDEYGLDDEAQANMIQVDIVSFKSAIFSGGDTYKAQKSLEERLTK